MFCIVAPCFGGNIQYNTYTNVRYAFRVLYPSGVLIPQGEADNGDGQRFISKDKKVVMVASGINNPEPEEYSLKSRYNDDIKENKDYPGRRVTYKKLTKNWYVVSGNEGENIFYLKVIYKHNMEQFVTVMITYPKSQRAFYDPIVATISSNFKIVPEIIKYEHFKHK